MFVDRPVKPNHVLVVMDMRSRTDMLLQRQGASSQPVYRSSPFMKEILGKSHARTTRLALFEYGDKPTPAERGRAKAELVRFIAREKPAVVLVFPTPPEESEESLFIRGTLCWQALHAPDSMDEMRGTFWHYAMATVVCPMHPCVPTIDETYKLMNQQWAAWAHGWAVGPLSFEEPERMLTVPDQGMVDALAEMRGKTLSVDIETIDRKGIITAVGLSAGRTTVSVPWDRWEPSKEGASMEPGIRDYSDVGLYIEGLVKLLLADPSTTKVGQNFLYDLPRLKAAGLPVGGVTEDTLAAHAIMYPTLPHGLQKACASMFCVAPWKSTFKTPFSKEDDRAWHYEPAALREYNALDAFQTLLLWERLRAKFI